MTTDRNPSKRPRVDELDGLRAFLALWVVAEHILGWAGFGDLTFSAHLQFFWATFMDGGTAVEVFMILSGFAISFLLNGRPQTYMGFMTGRFFRIYPVYLFCLAFALMTTFLVPGILDTASWKNNGAFDFQRTLHACERADLAGQLSWHLTLLNGLLSSQLLPYGTFTFLLPAWSITLEWQYYLVAPFLARIVRSGIGIVGLLLLTLLAQHFGQGKVNNPDAFLPMQLPLFLTGIGSYHLYDWYCRADQPQSRLYVLPVAALFALAVFSHWHVVSLSIWAAAFGCIFVRGDDLLSRLLSAVRWFLLYPFLQRLGRMSYTIYLIHWPILVLLLSAMLHLHPALSGSLAALFMFLIGLPLIFCASTLLHEYLELPGMALGKRLSYRKADAQPPKGQQKA
jgi:peptidoglycan/LPS O-acetylase OafA/YrhL